MNLGIDLWGAASSILPAVFGPDGGGAPGVAPSPGMPTTPVGPDGGVTAQISPAIQTQISPQISPTMTQIQSSPGAGVMAAPQQITPGAQTAVTPMGVPGEAGSILPSQPQYGYGPQPSYEPIALPAALPAALQPTTGVEGINWTPIIVAGVAAIVALGIFGQRRKRQ